MILFKAKSTPGEIYIGEIKKSYDRVKSLKIDLKSANYELKHLISAKKRNDFLGISLMYESSLFYGHSFTVKSEFLADFLSLSIKVMLLELKEHEGIISEFEKGNLACK